MYDSRVKLFLAGVQWLSPTPTTEHSDKEEERTSKHQIIDN